MFQKLIYRLTCRSTIVNASVYLFSKDAIVRIREWAVGPVVYVSKDESTEHEFIVTSPENKVLYHINLEGLYVAA